MKADQFITYSQNFEDLMLNRALKNITQGFYIDLGAADPTLNSVTKTFYDRGWRGINVEPSGPAYKRLQRDRPRDVNLNYGAWSNSGEVTIYLVDNGNELTTLSPLLMDVHKANGWEILERTIPVLSLTEIYEKYVPVGQDIHFLKVDVEGSEEKVFTGADFARWRPWIILFEAHEPERKSPHWHQSEKILIDAGYIFTYCDGLNRFYISKEKYDLLKTAFEVPPNVYDNWVGIEQLNTQAKLDHFKTVDTRAGAVVSVLRKILRVVIPNEKIRKSLMTFAWKILSFSWRALKRLKDWKN